MKLAITILFILFSNSLSAQAKLPNSKGQLDRTSVIRFSDKQIEKLKNLILDDKGHYINKNFPKAYRYISSQLIAMNASSNPRIDAGTIFWFDKADNINESAGWSSYMVRTYTTIGIQLADRDVGDLQRVSDDIAINVLTDVIEAHGVPPLQNILARDITAAMEVGNIKDLAGWGGSVFYWSMPLVDHNGDLIKDPISGDADDYLTLGDYILRNPERTRRFIKTSVLCIAYTPYLTTVTDINGLMKSLKAVKNLPDIVRLPIIEGVNEIDPIQGSVLSLMK
jgi:hypothetical protein